MASASQRRKRRQSDSPHKAMPQGDWRNWRPTARPLWLFLSIVLFVAWLGFLVSMIRLN